MTITLAELGAAIWGEPVEFDSVLPESIRTSAEIAEYNAAQPAAAPVSYATPWDK